MSVFFYCTANFDFTFVCLKRAKTNSTTIYTEYLCLFLFIICLFLLFCFLLYYIYFCVCLLGVPVCVVKIYKCLCDCVYMYVCRVCLVLVEVEGRQQSTRYWSYMSACDLQCGWWKLKLGPLSHLSSLFTLCFQTDSLLNTQLTNWWLASEL